jgi:hypothetical protein
MRRRHVLMMAVAAGCVLAPTAAAAQNVDPAVDDLRGNDVTFEEEALTFDELDQLDAVTHRLQDDGGYLKVIVLKEPVTDYDTARDYADDVHDELGGDGRIVVYTPNEVAVSSNVDPEEQVDAAERAAADTLNAGRSLDAATLAAAEELGVEPGSGEPASIPWGFILIMIAVPVGLLLVLWLSARKSRRQATALSAEEIGAAEKTVRATVDEAANDLLELADRVDQPGAPAEARDAFGLGAQLFSETQEELEQADTRGELEAVYPRVVEAGWRLDRARALLDGQPAPAKPDPPPLFPPDVVAVPVTVPAGEPGSRRAVGSARASLPPVGREPVDHRCGHGRDGDAGAPRHVDPDGSQRGGGGMVAPSSRGRGRGMGRR